MSYVYIIVKEVKLDEQILDSMILECYNSDKVSLQSVKDRVKQLDEDKASPLTHFNLIIRPLQEIQNPIK